MTGLIELELVMMRQTGKVEGEQDVQYIDSWGEAGWRRCSALGSWSAKLLRPSDALSEAHTASSFEDSIDYRTKLPRQRANSLKDEVAMPHYAGQGPNPPGCHGHHLLGPYPGRGAAVTGRGHCGSQLSVLLGLSNADRRARGAAMETWLLVMGLSRSRVDEGVVLQAGHAVSSLWDSC